MTRSRVNSHVSRWALTTESMTCCKSSRSVHAFDDIARLRVDCCIAASIRAFSRFGTLPKRTAAKNTWKERTYYIKFVLCCFRSRSWRRRWDEFSAQKNKLFHSTTRRHPYSLPHSLCDTQHSLSSSSDSTTHALSTPIHSKHVSRPSDVSQRPSVLLIR